MIRLYTICRVVAKTTMWMLIVLSLFVGLWFAGNRLLDESPHEDRAAFLVSPIDEIPDRQNIAIGLLGLTAPKGSDFFEYGSMIASLYRTASFSHIEEKMRGPGTLHLTVDPLQVFCWLYPRKNNDDCLPFEQVPGILRDNAELLKRFRSLHQLNQYSNLHIFFNSELINVNRLAIAEIYLHLEQGEYEIAYAKWRDQLLFSKNVLAGVDGLVVKIGTRISLGFTLPLLENILAVHPELAKKHKAELASLLQIDGIEAFNLEGTVRADYSVLKQFLETPPSPNEEWTDDRLHRLVFNLGQKQRIYNRYFAFAKGYAKALRQPWFEIDEEMSRLREIHLYSSLWDMLIDPLGTVLLGEYIGSKLKIGDDLIRMHAVDGKLRLASLLVRITVADVKDEAIPAFIKATGPAYHDPFSKEPMKWDPERRRIYFPHQDSPCAVYESFRIPDNQNRVLLPMSRTARKFC